MMRGRRSIQFIRRYLEEIGDLRPTLSAVEEQVLINRYKSGCSESLNDLVLFNQYIVIEEALYFSCKGLEIEDLIQYANLALLISLDKYRLGRSDNLKNYLHRNIFRYISNIYRDIISIIRYPQNRFDAIVSYFYKDISDYHKTFTQPIIECPDIESSPIKITEDPTADYSNVPFFRVEATILLDYMIGPSVEEQYYDGNIQEDLINVLSELKQIERDVLIQYFGIGQDFSLTLQELGDDLNLTRERVRQIKEKAIERLSHPERAKRIQGLLDCFTDTDFNDYPALQQRMMQSYLLDPFMVIDTDHKHAVELLEQYVAPRRRTIPYPHMKNMAQICRIMIVSYLDNAGRPCTASELKNYVLDIYPLFKDGVIDYALKTAKGVAYLGDGLYMLAHEGSIH